MLPFSRGRTCFPFTVKALIHADTDQRGCLTNMFPSVLLRVKGHARGYKMCDLSEILMKRCRVQEGERAASQTFL